MGEIFLPFLNFAQMTIHEFKTFAIKKLSKSSPTPALDVDVFLLHILKCSKTFLLLNRDLQISEKNLNWLQSAVEKRCTGLPVAYITNCKEFYGFEFYVTPDVLIPKPDTEILVEQAIFEIEQKFKNSAENLQIVDVCTGSGCIIISVLKSILEKNPKFAEKIEAFASDISENALKIAKKNAEMLLTNQENIKFLQGDLLAVFPNDKKFDVILSNPPYIPSKMVDELLKDGRNEPRLALDGDLSAKNSDGLAIIRRLIPQVFEKLKTNGIFLIETGEYNAKETAKIMKEIGFSKVETFKDLEGQLRVTKGIKI